MKRFPLLQVSGTHRDIGLAIGEMQRDRIRDRMEARKRLIPGYQSYLDKIPEYIAITKKYFPKLVEEVEGIVEASGVAFDEYFFAQARDLYPFYIEGDADTDFDGDHCTVAVSFNTDGVIIGDNEDWITKALDDLYLLKATINGTTFFGLQYAVSIPGEAACINNWGLVQCITEIHPTSQFGVPKNFVSRAILEARTLEEAEKIITNTPKASGYNHVLVQGDRVWNFEIAGEDYAVERLEKEKFVHTNHFTSDKLKKYEEYRTKSSVFRYERAQRMNKDNLDLEGMKRLLCDGQGEYPICRPNETIGSLIFQPKKGLIQVCYGMPSLDGYMEYKL